MTAAEIISIVCFLTVIIVTVVLIIRDINTKKECEKKLDLVTHKINEVNRSKFEEDKTQYDKLMKLEDTVNYVQNNYVSKNDMNAGITTKSLVADSLTAEYAKINSLEIGSVLKSKNFGMVNPNAPQPNEGQQTNTRQDCANVEKFVDYVPQGFNI